MPLASPAQDQHCAAFMQVGRALPCEEYIWKSSMKQWEKQEKKMPNSNVLSCPCLIPLRFFILPTSPVNRSPTLLIFPRAAPFAVFCLNVVWMAHYTNLDLSSPTPVPCNSIIDWLDRNEKTAPIYSYVLPLKAPSDWKVYHMLHSTNFDKT